MNLLAVLLALLPAIGILLLLTLRRAPTGCSSPRPAASAVA
jgi:hypothetical protein